MEGHHLGYIRGQGRAGLQEREGQEVIWCRVAQFPRTALTQTPE